MWGWSTIHCKSVNDSYAQVTDTSKKDLYYLTCFGMIISKNSEESKTKLKNTSVPHEGI